MKRGLVACFLMMLCVGAFGQNNIKVVVRNDETKLPLAGASVIIASLQKGGATDSMGIAVLHDLPNGVFNLQVSYIGYTTSQQKINLPAANTIEVMLEASDDQEDSGVVVTATRTDRSIRNTPTRVEVLAGGEISENTSMRPGEIKMLLNETTGIITQPTSAISNTANLRIQELDGRYTQILRDGLPLYSGLSEGLSLVQIAPLDLKQVEIIKGSSSTLYGGGAIAGLINLVSKTPGDKRELNFLANGTSSKGLDLSSFYSEKYGKAGLSFFASRNSGAAYDPAHIGFTAQPQFTRYSFTPRLFLYGTRTNASIGLGYTTENRLGGNINYIMHGTPGYFEKNSSGRFTTQLLVTHSLHQGATLTFKNSYNHFNRTLDVPTYTFDGTQQSSFSEISWSQNHASQQWVAGLNLYTDDFTEQLHTSGKARNYHYNTLGGFVQNTWSIKDALSLETGARADYTNPYGLIFLPRLSFLFRVSENLTSRLGGGLGYKLPTIFTEESEERHFQNILPVQSTATQYERSAGGNFDLTYHARIDEVKLMLNPLFFYTRIYHPLVLQSLAGGEQQFVNADGYTDSKGVDVNLRATLKEFSFFTGYSYTVAQDHFNGGTAAYPLSPRNRLHFDGVYEKEGKLRVAFEAYYTGSQQLTDGTMGRPYWLLGALVERSWKHFSLFINGEDLNDARQTKWDTIYTGPVDQPQFKDIYTPLEGRTINGGIKIKLD